MTPRFLSFVPFIFEWETEYQKGHYGEDAYVRTEHDPDDPGGATRYGIDKRSHPREDIENLSKERATEIYFEEWSSAGCESMPDKLGEVYFNACVNAGVGRADKLLAIADGSASAFLDAQGQFYRNLAAKKPRMQKYLKGWLNRVDTLRKFLNL